MASHRATPPPYSPTEGWTQSPLLLRRTLLAMIILNLLLVGANVLSYKPFLQQPNSSLYILEPVTLLIVYAGIVLVFTRGPDPDRRIVLRIGTQAGLAAGLLWTLSLAIETFANLTAPANIFGTAPFLLGGFALWGIAGYKGARQTNTVRSGILAAIWAGMSTVLLTITFGFLLGMVALPRLAQQIAGSPEQISSGWQDLWAFAIANQFDASFQHLLGALIIGSIVGAIGAVAGSGQRHNQAHRVGG